MEITTMLTITFSVFAIVLCLPVVVAFAKHGYDENTRPLYETLISVVKQLVVVLLTAIACFAIAEEQYGEEKMLTLFLSAGLALVLLFCIFPMGTMLGNTWKKK